MQQMLQLENRDDVQKLIKKIQKLKFSIHKTGLPNYQKQHS